MRGLANITNGIRNHGPTYARVFRGSESERRNRQKNRQKEGEAIITDYMKRITPDREIEYLLVSRSFIKKIKRDYGVPNRVLDPINQIIVPRQRKAEATITNGTNRITPDKGVKYLKVFKALMETIQVSHDLPKSVLDPINQKIANAMKREAVASRGEKNRKSSVSQKINKSLLENRGVKFSKKLNSRNLNRRREVLLRNGPIVTKATRSQFDVEGGSNACTICSAEAGVRVLYGNGNIANTEMLDKITKIGAENSVVIRGGKKSGFLGINHVIYSDRYGALLRVVDENPAGFFGYRKKGESLEEDLDRLIDVVEKMNTKDRKAICIVISSGFSYCFFRDDQDRYCFYDSHVKAQLKTFNSKEEFRLYVKNHRNFTDQDYWTYTLLEKNPGDKLPLD